MGWKEAADLTISGLEKTIGSKIVTYDFARLMDGATEVKCSEFGQTVANLAHVDLGCALRRQRASLQDLGTVRDVATNP